MLAAAGGVLPGVTLVTLLSIIVAILTVVTFVAAYHSRSQIRQWFRGTPAADKALGVATDALAAYETRIKQQDEQISHLTTLVNLQQEQIKLLTDLVTSRGAIEALSTKTDAYHQAILHHLDKLMTEGTATMTRVLEASTAQSVAVLQAATPMVAGVHPELTPTPPPSTLSS